MQNTQQHISSLMSCVTLNDLELKATKTTRVDCFLSMFVMQYVLYLTFQQCLQHFTTRRLYKSTYHNISRRVGVWPWQRYWRRRRLQCATHTQRFCNAFRRVKNTPACSGIAAKLAGVHGMNLAEISLPGVRSAFTCVYTGDDCAAALAHCMEADLLFDND